MNNAIKELVTEAIKPGADLEAIITEAYLTGNRDGFKQASDIALSTFDIINPKSNV